MGAKKTNRRRGRIANKMVINVSKWHSLNKEKYQEKIWNLIYIAPGKKQFEWKQENRLSKNTYEIFLIRKKILTSFKTSF